MASGRRLAAIDESRPSPRRPPAALGDFGPVRWRSSKPSWLPRGRRIVSGVNVAATV